MKRQQSILSFFHKPPSTDKPPSNADPQRGNPTPDDVTGTDTPPEKEHRSFFAAGVNGEAKGSGGGSMFNSIKHKFIRPNNTVLQKPTDRNPLDGGHDNIHSTSNNNNLSNGRDKESLLSGFPRMKVVIDLDALDGGHDNIHSTSNNNNFSNGRDKESSLSGFPRMEDVIDLDETDVIDLDETAEGNITGPEIPGARPLVPRLKRVQEDGFNFGSATTHSSIDNSKRVKFSHDFSAEGSKGKKGVRGITMNIDLKKAVALTGPQKIDFDIDDQGTYCHVGPHASWFSNYVGELIREFPYYHRSWRDIPAADKAHVHDKLSEHFDIASHLAGPHGEDIRDGIEDYFNRRYSDNKHNHKVKNFTKKGGVAKAEEIRSQRPENVTPEDWNRQVDFWINPKRLHVAEVNSRNRMANTISSFHGSRSLVATRHNLFTSSPEGVYPDLIQTYYDSHTKDGVWKEPQAEARYNEMIRLREASTSSGIAMTDREILAQVIKGNQRGHIPGVGRKVSGVGKSSIFGSKSRQQSCSSAEIDEKMKKQEEETKAAKETAKKLEKELATTQQQVSQMMAFLSSQPGFTDQLARAFSSSSTNDGNEDGKGNGE